MLVFSRNIGKTLERQIICCYATASETKTEVKGKIIITKTRKDKCFFRFRTI